MAYKAGAALSRCLASLATEDAEIIVVDNGGGQEIEAARQVPRVRVFEPSENVGFAAGCNLGAREATGEVLLFLNPDTVVVDGAVAALARTSGDPQIGIAMARLRLLDRPELLNSAGTVVHVSGLAWAGRFGEPAEDLEELTDVASASGAALAVRRDTFRELGGFTDELFMYQEDVELSWRAHLRGLRVVLDPRADVLHEYDFGRHKTKISLLERNRLIFVLTTYSLRLLILLAPMLMLGELAMLALAIRRRWFRGKVGGWWWLLRHPRWLARHRRKTQRLRNVRDRELARFLTPALDPKMTARPRGIGFLNSVLGVYWSLARRGL